MAATDKKKPLSLNERHNRLLQDLSASQSTKQPPSSRFIHGEGKNQSSIRPEESRRLFQNDGFDDDAPKFSGIVDFDSPSLDDGNAAGEELIGRGKPDKPPSETNSNVVDGKVDTAKVKIQGRRRLCKLSSKNDDCYKSNVSELSAVLEDQIPEISDFCSPPPSKAIDASAMDGATTVMDGDDCGGNEIRNILDELTSKLDVLTIEKKTKPRMTEQKGIDSKKVIDQKKDDVVDYTSAGSSFSHSSDKSGSSSDAAQSGVGQGIGTKQVQDESESESEVDNFVKSVNASTYVSSRQVKETMKVEPKEIAYKPSVSHIELGDDDEDDCVVLTTEKPCGDRRRYGHKWVEKHGDSSVVDIGDDENVAEIDSEDKHVITMKGPISNYTLSGKIGKMLYPHQREGLKWLWSLHCQGKGGILGDDMGLGKTMQICGYLAGLFSSRLIKRVMIVAPKTLIPHWIKELSVVGLSDKTREYFGTCPKLRQYELQYVLQDKGILLTTYDIVRNNTRQLKGSCSFDDESDEDGPIWDYMVLDEGHLIKNPSTQRAKSLLDIPSAHRIIISGTPIQNNLKELWALFNFCCPDLLGDKKDFKERYEHPILRGNEKRASERDKRVGSMVAKELRDRIQPYFLRRLKTEVFSEDNEAESSKLSKKNEIIVWLRLTSCQRHLYEAFLKSELVLSAFDGSPLAAITILKKICDHPLLLTKRAAEDVLEGMDSMLNQEDRGMAEKLAMHMADFTDVDDFQEKHDNLSCKISFILSLLENLIPQGHNVLIFSQTRKMLNLIQEALVLSGYEFLRIDGTTKASDRLKIVNDFQDGHGAPIFLLTSQVGGLGLTLTKADRVIVVDPAWNPSTDNQSVDRAYRIGQRKDVIVYRLMTCATIEEKIYRMQIFKGGLFKTATEHKEQTRYFSQQDLKDLFKLPKEEDGGFDVSLTQQQLHEEHYRQIKLNDSLKDHIEFLESLGIGGVSHHSLLYSKTEPASIMLEEDKDKDIRRKGIMRNKYSYSSSQSEHVVDGAQFAFKPKDMNNFKSQKKTSPMSSGKQTESDIKEKISRLSQILSNKATVSKLPDRGERIRKQIVELNWELDSLVSGQSSSNVIDLDDIADNLKRTLIV